MGLGRPEFDSQLSLAVEFYGSWNESLYLQWWTVLPFFFFFQIKNCLPFVDCVCLSSGILWRVVCFLLLGLRTKEWEVHFLQLCFGAKFCFLIIFSPYPLFFFFISPLLCISFAYSFFSFLSFPNPKVARQK